MDVEIEKLLEIQRIEERRLLIYEKKRSEVEALKIIQEQKREYVEVLDALSSLERATEVVQEKLLTLNQVFDARILDAKKLVVTNLEEKGIEDLCAINSALEQSMLDLQEIENQIDQLNEVVGSIIAELEEVKLQAEEEKENYMSLIHETIMTTYPELEEISLYVHELLDHVQPSKARVYKELREDDVFPAITKIVEGRCYSCERKLNAESLRVFKERGYSRCNHCGRILANNVTEEKDYTGLKTTELVHLVGDFTKVDRLLTTAIIKDIDQIYKAPAYVIVSNVKIDIDLFVFCEEHKKALNYRKGATPVYKIDLVSLVYYDNMGNESCAFSVENIASDSGEYISE